MKIKSEITWAILLVGTAAVSFYWGTRTGTYETEEILKSRIEQKAGKILILENKVEQLSEELTSRGIYSYPQASIVSENNSNATVVIVLNGKEPINQLEIEKKSFAHYTGNADERELREPKGTRTYLETLSAHNPVAFEIDNFEKEMGINLTFKSGQNKWHQYIRARKTPKGEIKTFWVITNKDSEVIDKHIDEGFPTDNEGHLILGPTRKIKYSEIKMNSIFHSQPLEQDEKSGI